MNSVKSAKSTSPSESPGVVGKPPGSGWATDQPAANQSRELPPIVLQIITTKDTKNTKRLVVMIVLVGRNRPSDQTRRRAM